MCKILAIESINGVNPEGITKVGIWECGYDKATVRWGSTVVVIWWTSSSTLYQVWSTILVSHKSPAIVKKSYYNNNITCWDTLNLNFNHIIQKRFGETHFSIQLFCTWTTFCRVLKCSLAEGSLSHPNFETFDIFVSTTMNLLLGHNTRFCCFQPVLL